eukprot:6195716-Pleurochrysis_carterae.AAC.2
MSPARRVTPLAERSKSYSTGLLPRGVYINAMTNAAHSEKMNVRHAAALYALLTFSPAPDWIVRIDTGVSRPGKPAKWQERPPTPPPGFGAGFLAPAPPLPSKGTAT